MSTSGASGATPVERHAIYAPEFRIERVHDAIDGEAVNLFIQTFEQRGGEFYSYPPQTWPLLATLTPSYVRTYPIWTNNPTAQRYRSRQQSIFRSVVFAHPDLDELPNTAQEAAGLVENRVGYLCKDRFVGLGFPPPLDMAAAVIGSVRPNSDLIILEDGETHLSGDNIAVTRRELEDLNRKLLRVARRKNDAIFRERRSEVINNILAKLTPNESRLQRISPVPSSTAAVRLPRRQTLAAGSLAVSQVRQSLDVLASSKPEALLKLKADIELVTLREMISRFEKLMMANHVEAYWQKFFEANLFVLSLVFSSDVKLVQGQAHVGGVTLSGAGAKIGDFLLGEFSRNVALVEIKRPTTALLGKEYRGIFPPSQELSGSIVQVLRQSEELLLNWQAHAYRNELLKDLRPERIRRIVVVGTLPDVEEERRSLNLFREASKLVEIVTFDELLSKLKATERHLSPQLPETP